MKYLLFAILSCFVINSNAQITFEMGYIIDDNGNKIECLIKNVDWKNNPDNFKYKLINGIEVLSGNLENIKVLEIYNQARYVRANILLDKSSNNINSLDSDAEPSYESKKVFLKNLVSGNVNLYSYSDRNATKFFYKIDTSNTYVPLIFKMYSRIQGRVEYNQSYKQQLLKVLVCDSVSVFDIDKTGYFNESLIDLFIKYNNCSNKGTVMIYRLSKSTNRFFHFSVRPRVMMSSLNISEPATLQNIEFKNKVGYGLGVETEIILPFNKNKWSIILEPTFLSYKNSSTISNNYVAEVNYQALEIPLGLRHYFYLNNESRIFINAQYVLNLKLNSSIDFKRGNQITNKLNVSTIGKIDLGAGYSFKKHKIELRYSPGSNFLDNYVNWSSKYKSLSFVYGFQIF